MCFFPPICTVRNILNKNKLSKQQHLSASYIKRFILSLAILRIMLSWHGSRLFKHNFISGTVTGCFSSFVSVSFLKDCCQGIYTKNMYFSYLKNSQFAIARHSEMNPAQTQDWVKGIIPQVSLSHRVSISNFQSTTKKVRTGASQAYSNSSWKSHWFKDSIVSRNIRHKIAPVLYRTVTEGSATQASAPSLQNYSKAPSPLLVSY